MWKASQGMHSCNPSTRKADRIRFLEFTGSRSNQICEVKVQWESVSQKIMWRTIAQDTWCQPQTSICKLTLAVYTQGMNTHVQNTPPPQMRERENDLNLGICKEFLAFVNVFFTKKFSHFLMYGFPPQCWEANSTLWWFHSCDDQTLRSTRDRELLCTYFSHIPWMLVCPYNAIGMISLWRWQQMDVSAQGWLDKSSLTIHKYQSGIS